MTSNERADPRANSTQGETPDLIPVRMLNEYVYCPRLLHLEWVQSEWADNVYTEDGRDVHRRADREQARAVEPDADAPFSARSLHLSSETLGLTTKLDVIEGEGNRAIPIEYKRGKPAPVPERVYDPERVQVCAQALVLRENGFDVPRGEVFFAGSRERVEVALTQALVDQTLAAIRGVREAAARVEPPPPLVDDPRCNGCSLVGICLPDEVVSLQAAGDDPAAEPPPLRRVHPGRDDALPFYVQQGGTKLGVRGDLLVVKEKGKKIGEARLPRTSQVAVFGGVQVSTQAVRRLLREEIPLLYFSAGGWFYGWTRGHGSKNVELRRAQFRAADDPARSLQLARAFVGAKIANQRTVLRRNLPSASPNLERLTRLRSQAAQAETLESLLGLEGTAARLYFEEFPDLLKGRWAEGDVWSGRNRRPPQDPVNAILSFLYALLTKEWTIACAAAGLDPYLGFFHQPRYGRPSLALDLMEEFRPLVADSVALTVLNTGELAPEDFVRSGLGVALRSRARKRLIAAYERRLSAPISHPVFGYRISYRRTFEVQARLLGRYLAGEIDRYPSFLTR